MLVELTDGKIKRLVEWGPGCYVEPFTKGDRGKDSDHGGCQVMTPSGYFTCDEGYEEVRRMLKSYLGDPYLPLFKVTQELIDDDIYTNHSGESAQKGKL